MQWLHVYPLVQLIYFAAPLISLGIAAAKTRRSRSVRPIRLSLRTCLTGAFCGGAVATLYDVLGQGHVSILQMLMACYFGAATLCIVYAFNVLIAGAIARLFSLIPFQRWGFRFRNVRLAAHLIQMVLLMVVGLPYLGSVLLLYRPGIPSPGNPLTLIEAPYEVVHFRSTDSIPLEAWWIPATRNTFTDGRGSTPWGQNTILLCPGFGADKASDLFLARDLVANGFNVLAIDLRAQGRSSGRFTGLGSVESRDVLGAVRWVRANHPDQSRRILGLGESVGAAALLQAAVDPSDEGQSIDALAVYNPYAKLGTFIDDMARDHTSSAGRWVLRHAIVPVASIQLGTNLLRFSPAAAAQNLWPRPILVLGNSTSREPIEFGAWGVFQDAMQPRYAYFNDDEDRNEILHDKTAALTVRIFFDQAKSVL